MVALPKDGTRALADFGESGSDGCEYIAFGLCEYPGERF
jgi:hypothetical protein